MTKTSQRLGVLTVLAAASFSSAVAFDPARDEVDARQGGSSWFSSVQNNVYAWYQNPFGVFGEALMGWLKIDFSATDFLLEDDAQLRREHGDSCENQASTQNDDATSNQETEKTMDVEPRVYLFTPLWTVAGYSYALPDSVLGSNACRLYRSTEGQNYEKLSVADQHNTLMSLLSHYAFSMNFLQDTPACFSHYTSHAIDALLRSYDIPNVETFIQNVQDRFSPAQNETLERLVSDKIEQQRQADMDAWRQKADQEVIDEIQSVQEQMESVAATARHMGKSTAIPDAPESLFDERSFDHGDTDPSGAVSLDIAEEASSQPEEEKSQDADQVCELYDDDTEF